MSVIKVFHPFVSKFMTKYMYDTSCFKDPLKYRSVFRKALIKSSGLHGIVENHHIIPKQWENHNLFDKIKFDVHSSYNIVMLPNIKHNFYIGASHHMIIHESGHKKYNEYVKVQLDELLEKYSDDDEFKYNFWLFHTYLKASLNNNSTDIPWN